MRGVIDQNTLAAAIAPLPIVSRGTERLHIYSDLLIKAQKAINLTASGEDIWERHILDSAQLLPLLPSLDIRLADMGSGGGFPGLVLSLLGVREMHLIERDRRKAAFLREAVRVTNAAAVIHACDVADVVIDVCDVITARALAPLETLLSLAHPLMKKDAICLFPKGENYPIEYEAAKKSWQFHAEHFVSKTGSGAVLRISEVRPF